MNRFSVGQLVSAQWNGEEEWFEAKISRQNPDGTYDLDYKDGDKESSVDPKYMDALDVTEEEIQSRPPITVGLRVKARFYGETAWYDGVVRAVDARDGTYEIDYDDGDEEIKVLDKYIKFPFYGKRGAHFTPKISVPSTHPFYVGQIVWAEYKGDGDHFEAKIVGINEDGTYEVHYKDGDVESNVETKYLEAIDLTQHELESRPLLIPGDRVYARYFADYEWEAAVITAVNSQGTFELLYDDGDKESHVQAQYIEFVSRQAPVAPPSKEVDDETVSSDISSEETGSANRQLVVAVDCPCRCTIL